MSEADIFTRGRITWTDAGTEDEGVSLGLGEGCMIYFGPVSGKNGCWMVAYAGDEVADIGEVENMEAARVLIERLAELITPNAEAR